MARHDEAAAAVSLIARSIEPLSEACLENQGVMHECDVPLKLIMDLLAQRLAFRLDESEPYIQINRVVSDLFAHITQSSRRRISSGEIADLYGDLNHNITNYFEASAAGNIDDKKHYELSVQANIADLIDSLNMITSRFAGYVRNEFSIVSSLTQRIRENHRAIDEAARLNDLFATIMPVELASMARSDFVLSRLLVQLLGKAVRSCTEDLHVVLHKLRENLTKLEADEKYQRKNELIDSMLQHYQRNPNYQPQITQHEHLPKIFGTVTPLKLEAHAPIDSAVEEYLLAEYAQAALNRIKASDKPKKPVVVSESVAIVDGCGEVYIEALDWVEEALANLFEILPELTKKQPVSSLDCLNLLALDLEPKIWNLCVVDHYSNSAFASGKEIQMGYIETQEPDFSGNHAVTDIVFKRTYA